MLSTLPIDLDKVKKENIDREILRVGMIAELDAVNLYEQLAAKTQSDKIRKVLLEIAKEEKTHLGEFQALLLTLVIRNFLFALSSTTFSMSFCSPMQSSSKLCPESFGLRRECLTLALSFS